MRGIRLACVLRIAILLVLPGHAAFAEDPGIASRLGSAVLSDFDRFYLQKGNLVPLGAGLAGAGILANTSADREVREFWQERLRGRDTDRVAKVAKIPGTALVTGPAYLGAYGAGRMLENETLETWAVRSARATLVGTPGALALQRLTGGGRPENGDSGWRPFKSSHGLSGHAFIGGVPLITAAKMSDDPYLKGAFYALSTLPGLSRINDDAHYFSQAALGWFVAYLSCDTVSKGKDVDGGRASFRLTPFPGGIGAIARF